MRSIVVWLIGILLLPGWMGHLYAQMPEPTPTVTLDMRQVPLLDILMELEKQTGLFFSYESSLLKELPEVSLSVRDESLSYCLKRLFSPLPIIYRVTGQYIILKRKPRQYTISGFVRDSASYESLLGASVLVKVDPEIAMGLALYHVMEDITNIYTTVKITHELLRVHSSINR